MLRVMERTLNADVGSDSASPVRDVCFPISALRVARAAAGSRQADGGTPAARAERRADAIRARDSADFVPQNPNDSAPSRTNERNRPWPPS
jgi:hypothetical protein